MRRSWSVVERDRPEGLVEGDLERARPEVERELAVLLEPEIRHQPIAELVLGEAARLGDDADLLPRLRLEPLELDPGQTILDCHGPKIGQSCKAKSDCDLACSCDDPKALLSPSHDHPGPKDGARGVTGVCGARVQVGVRMCQIDERGVVTHVIID